MYSVYKITNLINNKCYIGSSIRVEYRWREHKNTAFNSNSPRYNYPLYCAFRKYGLDNFSFQVLKDNFATIKEMTDFEAEMIIYYDSYKNGYNQTLKTDRRENAIENLSKYSKIISKKCAKIDKFNNIIEVYDSYHDAARKNGYDGEDRASSVMAVCKGEISSLNGVIFRDLDDNGNIISKPFKRQHGKKQIVGISVDDCNDEIYYLSISDAARSENIPRSSLSKCVMGNKRYSIVHGRIWREIDLYGNIIENNILIEDLIKEYNRTNPLINGERHNIKEWCNIYKITPVSFYSRIKKGMNVVEAITTPTRKKGGWK